MSAETVTRLERVTVEYVAADSVGPNDYNNHRYRDDQFCLLMASMDDDGFTTPILVDRASRRIVDGEHRWLAWIILSHVLRTNRTLGGMIYSEIRDLRQEVKELHSERIIEGTELPVVFVDYPPTQKRVSGLRHNWTRGYDDPDATNEIMIDILEFGQLEAAQKALQLSDVQLAKMIPELPPEAALGDLDLGEANDIDLSAPMMSAAVEEITHRTPVDGLGEPAEPGPPKKPYRLVCRFTGAEAEAVRAVLGSAPTRNLLKVCQHMFTHQKQWAKILKNGVGPER